MSGAALLEATENQARARVALNAALAGEPSHAYLFRGPRGSGKRAAARAFAAELIASASADPEDARRTGESALDPKQARPREPRNQPSKFVEPQRSAGGHRKNSQST